MLPTSAPAFVEPGPTRLSLREVFSTPMPWLEGQRRTRWLIRSVTALARPLILGVRGTRHVAVTDDPIIFVANHSQRLEAVIVPTLLYLLRGGRLIHFVADWNFMLMPGIATLLRHGQVLVSTRKSARPRFLNRFKPRYAGAGSPIDQARARLGAGHSVGIFPEGTVNRDPQTLMSGRHGAARLALETGVALVPCGIRFPRAARDEPIGDFAAMSIDIGPRLTPPACAIAGKPSRAEVRALHAETMQALSRLSGKAWIPATRETDADE